MSLVTVSDISYILISKIVLDMVALSTGQISFVRRTPFVQTLSHQKIARPKLIGIFMVVCLFVV